MSEKTVQLKKEIIKSELIELVRSSVEETLNNLLEQEAKELTNAARYERTEARQGCRAGHYDRCLTTTAGEVTLNVPKLAVKDLKLYLGTYLQIRNGIV
jgi:transposase-like protein